MSSMSLRLPDSLQDRVRILCKKEHVSMNQFIATAVAEKIASLETEEYLNARAKRATREKFETALSQIPDEEPMEMDRI